MIDASPSRNLPRPGNARWLSVALLLATWATTAHAEPAATGKPWSDMDYGPYMTHSFEAAKPSRNIAYKGVKIKLNEAGAAVLFDTDLLRYAAGWMQSDLDWRSVDFDGSHQTHPSILGEPWFANPQIPGCARDGKFVDPREFPYGPLPREWAHWKGLYLQGEQVILSYTIGDAAVLESPAIVADGDVRVLARRINIGKSSRDIVLQLCANDQDTTQLLTLDKLRAAEASATTSQCLAILGALDSAESAPKKEPESLRTGLVARWKFDEGEGEAVANATEKQFTGKLIAARWADGIDGKALEFDGKSHVALAAGDKLRLDAGDWTIAAWIKTTAGGTIVARGPRGDWEPQGKTFFVRDGRLCFDIGWVGVVESGQRVADGRWHLVAVSSEKKSGSTRLYVDGRLAGQKQLASDDKPEHALRIGYTARDFVPPFTGTIDDVRLYDRLLTAAELKALAGANAQAEPLTAVACNADRDTLQFDTSEPHHIRLRIPAAATPVRLTVTLWQGAAKQLPEFSAAARRVRPADDLAPLTRGGPPRWKEQIKTAGTLGTGDEPFQTDEISLPRKNPWRSWMRLGGFDFFPDKKRAAICTWNGDVWLVDGLDEKLNRLTWQRIATGMFQPLGLKIVDGQIYVSCRDQITRLHDLNGDREIDFYENFNNDHQVTEHFHEFAMDLQTDAAGNFYYAKSARHALPPVVPQHGTLLKVAADGSRTEIICNGFRAANGVGIGPRGELATSDQEGHWTPTNRINLVRPGGFYGNKWSFVRGAAPDTYEPPLVWLPKDVDRSPAEQLWVPRETWGPLAGRMLHTSYGTGWLWHVMPSEVDGVAQGGIVRLPLQFPTGIMRGRFSPDDGHLYLCGLVGWSSSCAVDGGFYRVRYTGKPLRIPIDLHVTDDGIAITFSEKLDADLAVDPDNFAATQWNYHWSANYGSPDFSVAEPKRNGRDQVEIVGASLSADGKTISLELDEVRPVMQMQIRYNVHFDDGVEAKDTLWLTINRVP